MGMGLWGECIGGPTGEPTGGLGLVGCVGWAGLAGGRASLVGGLAGLAGLAGGRAGLVGTLAGRGGLAKPPNTSE